MTDRTPRPLTRRAYAPPRLARPNDARTAPMGGKPFAAAELSSNPSSLAGPS